MHLGNCSIWNKEPQGCIIEHNLWSEASLILHAKQNWDMIGIICLLCSQSLTYSKERFLRFIKPKVLPPNVVSIFLSLLTNGAANQTGKSEKEVETN